MYHFVLCSLICLTLLQPCAVAQVTTPAGPPPNIILINADDMGYGDLGCFGHAQHRTPNLDRMAQEGARLTSFYVAQAVCSASRAALLTGCYSNRIGILGALGPKSNNGIHDNEMTIAQLLKSQGYHTACFGKWHLGHHQQFLPTRHGFDVYYGLPYSNDMWPGHPNPKAGYPDLPLIDGEKTIGLNPDQTRLTTDLTSHAVKFIKEHHQSRFLVYLAHPMPHVPLHVSAERSGKSAGGLYGDVIEEIDWSTGEILKTLQDLKIDEKTLVIFTSDNGPWLSYGNHGGTTAGYREGKGTSFEGGVRVPFIARWPGRIPGGLVCHQPCMTIDVLPALANLTKAKLPEHRIDGLNVWPLLSQRDAKTPHDVLYFYWNRELQAIRSGPWKLHLPHNYSSLKSQPGKDGKPGPYEQKTVPISLFQLEQDPGERVNLVDQEPEQVARIMKMVEAVRKDLGDSLTKAEGTGVRPPGSVKAQN